MISSIIEMTLMIRRYGIIQRVDHRPSVTSFWTSRSFALSIIHHDHVDLSADFPEMLLTHWSRDRRTLHLSLHVHDHSGVVLEVDEDAFLPVPGLPLTDHHHEHHLLPEHRLDLLHEAHTHNVKPRHCDLVQAASDALLGHYGKVLGVRVVRTIHDAHTNAYLELGFVLVLVPILVLDLVLVLVLDLVLSVLVLQLASRRFLSVLLWTLFVVRTCVRFTC